MLQLVSAPALVVAFADTPGTAVASARLGTNWAEAMCLPPQPPSKALLQLPSSPSCIRSGSKLVHGVEQNSGKQGCCFAITEGAPLKQSFREFRHGQSVWVLLAEWNAAFAGVFITIYCHFPASDAGRGDGEEAEP